MTIGVLDVDYQAQGARAAGVIAESWEAATPAFTCAEEIDAVEPYAPGQFYRRELPCLLAVLRQLPALPDVIVVDGYVWLPPGECPGLGARLHQALGGAAAVVGIAKTAFAGAEAAAGIVPVLRGSSRRPLFVTAIGMEPAPPTRPAAPDFRKPSPAGLNANERIMLIACDSVRYSCGAGRGKLHYAFDCNAPRHRQVG